MSDLLLCFHQMTFTISMLPSGRAADVIQTASSGLGVCASISLKPVFNQQAVNANDCNAEIYAVFHAHGIFAFASDNRFQGLRSS